MPISTVSHYWGVVSIIVEEDDIPTPYLHMLYLFYLLASWL